MAEPIDPQLFAGARCARPDVARRGIRARAAEKIGHRFGIAQRAEHRLYTSPTNRWEKVLHVHPQHHAPGRMWGGEAADRPALREAVCSVVGWNLLEDLA